MLAAIILAAEAIKVDVGLLNLVVAVFIPLLVGLLTKRVASSGLKASINLLASAIVGAIGTVIAADGALEVQSFLLNILTTWGTSQISYTGLWAPTKIAEVVQIKTDKIGIGVAKPELEAEPKAA